MPPRVLLDCDPGHDDAFALLFAAQRCELVAVTTVSGNVPLASTTRNALRVCDVADLDVPVHAGAARPLVASPLHAEHIHGTSGLDGPADREPRRRAEAQPAVEAILQASRREEGLWIVATGPLTNLALALRLDPGLTERVAGISLMGGSRTFGNTTAAAEFNILADPEAADVVFESGARIVMAGLDLTHRFRLGQEETDALRVLDHEVGRFAAELLAFYLGRYRDASGGSPHAPMHDPCAVLALTDPELFEREQLQVRVELRGEHTRGMTVCDRRDLHKRGAPNVEVLVDVDAHGAWERLRAALASYGPAR